MEKVEKIHCHVKKNIILRAIKHEALLRLETCLSKLRKKNTAILSDCGTFEINEKTELLYLFSTANECVAHNVIGICSVLILETCGGIFVI